MHQRGDHMLEDHPIRDPRPMTAQRMGGRDARALGQQRRELVPKGLQQAHWQDRHGASTAGMACTCTVAGARACPLLLFSHLPIVGRSKAAWASEYTLRQGVQQAYLDVAKASIDRSQTRAQFVQVAAGAIATAYGAILALLPKGDAGGGAGSAATPITVPATLTVLGTPMPVQV